MQTTRWAEKQQAQDMDSALLLLLLLFYGQFLLYGDEYSKKLVIISTLNVSLLSKNWLLQSFYIAQNRAKAIYLLVCNRFQFGIY